MTHSIQEMRMDQADLARDEKKEGGMCASALCTRSHNLRDAPDGYRGRYGGHQLCEEHYREVVDYIARFGHLPSESECRDSVGKLGQS
jgi:hypothetical protein